MSDQLCLRYSTKAECDTCPLSPGVLGTRKWMPRHQTLTMRHLGIDSRKGGNFVRQLNDALVAQRRFFSLANYPMYSKEDAVA